MAYRERGRGCPVCGEALHEVRTERDRLERCGACSGVWLEWSTFQAMWMRMGPGSGDPVFAARTDGRERSCPTCARPMSRVQLRAVPIDHCGVHGVWFDRVELEAALAAAALPPDQWFHLFAAALVKMS